MRKTKVVVTLGPASDSPDVFRRLVDAGLDVARINLSHGSVDHHRTVIRMVRQVEQAVGRPIGIMLDTAGPEVRMRTRNGQELSLMEGQYLSLGSDPDCDLIPSIKELVQHVQSGHQLVVGDGNLILEVVEAGDPAKLQVIQGGVLTDNKKITCPGVVWPLPVLTEGDRTSLQMGIAEGIDWVAASFIRTDEDVIEVRRQMESWSANVVPIMAKIETRLAIENLDSVIRMSDGVMVARGDLGVEYPAEDVPWLQKRIIDAANRAGKPVVTATQMLESMVHDSRPTRAEITDIAHAVLEGTDAVMLSEETAAGEYPVQAVKVMARAAEVAEAHPWDSVPRARYGQGTVTDAVCHAALTAAEDLEARVIITATESGHTAQSMAAHRPKVPILALTPYESVARRLTIVWGLHTQLMNTHESLEAMVDESAQISLNSHWSWPGDRVIVTAGAPIGEAGSTNVLRVVTVGDILLKGQGLGPEGQVHGEILKVRNPREVRVEDVAGKVLVVGQTDGEWTPYMQRARAIIAEAGGLTSHAAIIGISSSIPTVVGVDKALDELEDGQTVTVDAGAGTIRAGRHHAS